MDYYIFREDFIIKKIILSLLLVLILGCTDKTDTKGFYIAGKNKDIHKETKTKYDKEGYDKYGFNKGGFTRYGFNKKDEFEKNKFYKYKFEESKFIFANRYIYDKTQTMLTNGLRDIFFTNKDLKNLKKDQFETTSEFEIRKKNLVKKYSKEIEDIKNEYYIIYSRTNSCVEGKYDADNEEWSFNETYKTNSNDYYNSYYDYKFKNSPITINSKVKMPVFRSQIKKISKSSSEVFNHRYYF